MHTISALLWALGPNLEGHEKLIKEPTQEPVLLVANFLLSSTLTPQQLTKSCPFGKMTSQDTTTYIFVCADLKHC